MKSWEEIKKSKGLMYVPTVVFNKILEEHNFIVNVKDGKRSFENRSTIVIDMGDMDENKFLRSVRPKSLKLFAMDEEDNFPTPTEFAEQQRESTISFSPAFKHTVFPKFDFDACRQGAVINVEENTRYFIEPSTGIRVYESPWDTSRQPNNVFRSWLEVVEEYKKITHLTFEDFKVNFLGEPWRNDG